MFDLWDTQLKAIQERFETLQSSTILNLDKE